VISMQDGRKDVSEAKSNGLQAFPVMGRFITLPTPAGMRLFRVTKSSAVRTVLMPCSPEETRRLLAVAEAQRKARVERAWAEGIAARRGPRRWFTLPKTKAKAAQVLRGEG